jgi:chemotaxis signal transduction protein
MTGQEQWFCLFRGDAGPMAVPAESVAEVLEVDRLVRLAWSPPQVAGLCPFRREVIPVVRLTSSSHGAAGDPPGQPETPTVADPPAGTLHDGDHVRSILLILRAGRGAWGVRSDSAWTIMSRERPEYHPPRPDGDGPVLVGTILRAGVRYGVLDTEATWHGLRSAIGRWYGRIGEPETVTPIAPGVRRREWPQDGRDGAGACEHLGGEQ